MKPLRDTYHVFTDHSSHFVVLYKKTVKFAKSILYESFWMNENNNINFSYKNNVLVQLFVIIKVTLGYLRVSVGYLSDMLANEILIYKNERIRFNEKFLFVKK